MSLWPRTAKGPPRWRPCTAPLPALASSRRWPTRTPLGLFSVPTKIQNLTTDFSFSFCETLSHSPSGSGGFHAGGNKAGLILQLATGSGYGVSNMQSSCPSEGFSELPVPFNRISANMRGKRAARGDVPWFRAWLLTGKACCVAPLLCF